MNRSTNKTMGYCIMALKDGACYVGGTGVLHRVNRWPARNAARNMFVCTASKFYCPNGFQYTCTQN